MVLRRTPLPAAVKTERLHLMKVRPTNELLRPTKQSPKKKTGPKLEEKLMFYIYLYFFLQGSATTQF